MDLLFQCLSHCRSNCIIATFVTVVIITIQLLNFMQNNFRFRDGLQMYDHLNVVTDHVKGATTLRCTRQSHSPPPILRFHNVFYPMKYGVSEF